MVYYFKKIFFREFIERGEEIEKGAIVLLSYCVGSLDLKEERKGKSDKIKSLCVLAKERKLFLVVRADCFIEDRIFNSAIVIDKGKLLGICDCVTARPPYAQARNVYCFDTSLGRVAILLDKDILLKDLGDKLAEEECELVIHLGQVLEKTLSLFTAKKGYHLISAAEDNLIISVNSVRIKEKAKNEMVRSKYAYVNKI